MFEAVFKCTLDMITKNFEDFPEHRSNLFNLLRAINHHCFPALLADPSNFTLIIESIKWAFKHTERNVAETGLNTLLELLNNVQAGGSCEMDGHSSWRDGFHHDNAGPHDDCFHFGRITLGSVMIAILRKIARGGVMMAIMMM